MKITKKRLREIIKEELNLYPNKSMFITEDLLYLFPSHDPQGLI